MHYKSRAWFIILLSIITTTIMYGNAQYSCQITKNQPQQTTHSASTQQSQGSDAIYRIKQDVEVGHQGNNPHMHSLNPKNVLLSIITGIGNGLLTGFGNAAAEQSLLKGFPHMNWASLLMSWTIASGIRGTLDSLSQNYFLSIKTPYNAQVLCGASYVASWISYVFAYTQTL